MRVFPESPSAVLDEEQLVTIRGLVAGDPIDDYYPSPEDRLFADTPGVEIDHKNRRVVLPFAVNGEKAPWHVGDDLHPNRADALANPNLRPLLDQDIRWAAPAQVPPALSKRYQKQGYWLDQGGNGVLNAGVQMLEDPEIGGLTGLGSAWKARINPSSDGVIAVRETRADEWRLPMVQRRDNTKYNGTWAIPGGWVDERESRRHAARRELFEEVFKEAGIPLAALGKLSEYEALGHGLTIGPGATLHAMSEYALYMRIVQHAAAAALLGTMLVASRESHLAEWKTLSEIDAITKDGLLFPFHIGQVALVKTRLAKVA
jgi:ADP-ribose pyrophosphatase YjhB (NUDIX family)